MARPLLAAFLALALAAAGVAAAESLYDVALATVSRLEPELAPSDDDGGSNSADFTALSPHGGLTAVASESILLSRRADLLDELADALSVLRLRDRSAAARERALTLRLRRGEPAARAAVALATELQSAGRFADALAVVAAAQRRAESGAAALPGLSSVLLRLEASLLDCRGETVAALGRVARARKAERTAVPPHAPSVVDALQHVRLLRKVLLSETLSAPLPPQILQGLRDEWRRQQAELTGGGGGAGGWPWRDAMQLPKVYVAGLTAFPWRAPEQFVREEHRIALATAVALLERSSGALAAELRALRAGRLLEREEECIHDASDAASGSVTAWSVLTVNAPHLPRLDASGCSVDAPVACGVLAAAAAAGLRVLRGGYSVVGGSAHLAPHCGMTNAQLKMHVGLEVPLKPSGEACARIRVGNETRRWEQGRVLFFDDSFEHEVHNDCPGRGRAVFQLVFAHLELEDLVALDIARDPFGALAVDGGGGRREL